MNIGKKKKKKKKKKKEKLTPGFEPSSDSEASSLTAALLRHMLT